MHYVISDIHNDNRRFCELLEKIRFSESDHLYILGDVFDRSSHNPNPVDLYFNIERLYYCDGHYVKNKKDESLPVKFYVSNAYEVFSMFGSLWGGWNDCPEWRTVERKSKEWYEKYGAEIIKISHDSLEFKCYKKLVTEEIEQLMIEIAEFAPNSLDLANYETITEKLRREGRFVLWWD